MSQSETPIPSSSSCPKCRKAKKQLRKIIRRKAELWDKHVAACHNYDEGSAHAFGMVVGAGLGLAVCVMLGLIVIPAAASV